MSVLRDVRLLIARHLDLPVPTRAAIVEILNLLDSSLDNEGYEPTPEILAAIKKLERTILEETGEVELTEEEEEDTDDEEFIDLDDIEFDDEDDDDDLD